MLLIITTYWWWYVIFCFECIGCQYNQKHGKTSSLPHCGNEDQWRVNECWCCIWGNLSGDWLETVINKVLAAFMGKKEATHYLPHLENERHLSINGFQSCVWSNLCRGWLQTSIKKELLLSVGRWARLITMTASEKVLADFSYNTATMSSCMYNPTKMVKVWYIDINGCIALW